LKSTVAAIACILIPFFLCGQEAQKKMYKTANVYQTSRAGDKLTSKGSLVLSTQRGQKLPHVMLTPDITYQQILGFGGSFTEASAYVLSKLSPAKRKEVLNAYFRSDGAGYTLTRTHINSCDFSVRNYAYSNTPGDKELNDFSIAEDLDDLIPLIRDAMHCEGADFKIIATPWTAPPWMKSNNKWNDGSLLPEYYTTWALYFSKYLQEYSKQGIEIWGITVENEPLGNGGQWESMIFSPQNMAEFVKNHLAPRLQKNGLNTRILIFDHNRDQVKQWADGILGDPETAKLVWGTAVHWYSSTVEWYPDALHYVHEQYPGKGLVHTEGCIDSEVPRWHQDAWYWESEAKDWGYTWAPPADKHLHPKYVPVYRYARDIIGCLNSWVEGWVDWNIVLDTQGGPNHANNWCIAPVIAKPETDEVYYTPLFYVLEHFSKFFRPGARRIGLSTDLKDLMVTSCVNPDGTIAVAVLNQTEEAVRYEVVIGASAVRCTIDGNALQTIVIE